MIRPTEIHGVRRKLELWRNLKQRDRRRFLKINRPIESKLGIHRVFLGLRLVYVGDPPTWGNLHPV